MARISPVQVVPDVCTPLFSVLGAPPKPLGMVTGREVNGVRGLNASLLPRQREDGLHGCNGRLMRLGVGAGLAPLMVGKASRRQAGTRFSVGNGECPIVMAPS